ILRLRGIIVVEEMFPLTIEGMILYFHLRHIGVIHSGVLVLTLEWKMRFNFPDESLSLLHTASLFQGAEMLLSLRFDSLFRGHASFFYRISIHLPNCPQTILISDHFLFIPTELTIVIHSLVLFQRGLIQVDLHINTNFPPLFEI